MLGALYVPPALVTARYCVPLGTCTATTFASASGAPFWSVTTPLIAAVSLLDHAATPGSRGRHTAPARARSEVACLWASHGPPQRRRVLDTEAGESQGGAELAPKRKGGKGGQGG